MSFGNWLPEFRLNTAAEAEDMEMNLLSRILIREYPRVWADFLEAQNRIGSWFGLRDYVAEEFLERGYFAPAEIEEDIKEILGV